MTSETPVLSSSGPPLELDDIQASVLRPRPTPYAGRYVLLRIDQAEAGRELLRRLLPHVDSAAADRPALAGGTVNLALTFQGLAALGLPQTSLDSFPAEFRQGMAARADILGDTGESRPANWEAPFGTAGVHVALSLTAPDAPALAAAAAAAQAALRSLPGIAVVSELDVAALPDGRTHFGYRDGIGQPVVEGSGAEGLPGQGRPRKAGELLLGYPDERGQLPPQPLPEVLGHNGTYLAFRKLHQRVALFRQFLRANGGDASGDPKGEELLAAKLVGRWRSGAPLALAPEQDDPALGDDPQRNGAFLYGDDPLGLKCPRGAHMRRAYPRDSLDDQTVDVRVHRVLRRGTTYGPMLPEGALEDDGADRGIVFLFLGASLSRQFEFVKSQWLNDGNFVGLGAEQDAIAGRNDGAGTFTIPGRPIRRRLHDVPRFVITRGGEYAFVPGLRALRWLAGLDA